MKAIQIQRTGGPEVLEYVDVPTPQPGPAQVLVRAHSIGVNMPEVFVRKGVYRWSPPLPVIPGIEMRARSRRSARRCAASVQGNGFMFRRAN